MMAKKAPNPTDKHVGARVRMRRMMLSMSQEKLGDALSLTFQQVQKYEKGVNRISMGRLIRVGRALEVNVSYLLGADTGATPAITPSPNEHAEFAEAVDMLSRFGALRLLTAFSNIPENPLELRESIVRTVESIARQAG